jgi:hypothetical protein
MLITNPGVPAIDALLSWWESAEYMAEAFVILGCVGEFMAEFTEILKPEWRHRFSKISLLVLIAALAIELGALVRTNHLAGQEIALLNGVAADARTRAANAELTAKGFDSKIAEAQRGTEEAHRDAETAKERASNADERAAVNEKEAARLSKAAEDERLARIKIEERVAWRRLTKDQQSEIGLRLKPFSGQVALVQYDGNDIEEYEFGLDIASALQLAQWRISEPLGMLMMREGPVSLGTNPPIETGVMIKSTGDKIARNASDALLHELLVRGFDVSRSPENDSRPQSVVFVIMEHRPEGAQGEAKLRKQQK